MEQIEDFFAAKEKSLEEVYNKSTLPYGPPEDKIKELLLNCLEEFYGSLENAVVVPNYLQNTLREMDTLLDKLRGKFF